MSKCLLFKKYIMILYFKEQIMCLFDPILLIMPIHIYYKIKNGKNIQV